MQACVERYLGNTEVHVLGFRIQAAASCHELFGCGLTFGIMENKMETTIVYWGLYWDNGK